MSEGEPTPAEAIADADADAERSPVFSPYGVASALLAVLCVAAAGFAGSNWWRHHVEMAGRIAQTAALQAAADWTGVLINMNADNVDASLAKLHDGTVGQLNADFEASVRPYRDVVQTLKSHTTGQIQAVAIEEIHHNLDVAPGAPVPPAAVNELPPGLASRTDTVMVVATSVSQNVGGQPQTVHWNLRLDVSDVDGRLLISRLESLR